MICTLHIVTSGHEQEQEQVTKSFKSNAKSKVKSTLSSTAISTRKRGRPKIKEDKQIRHDVAQENVESADNNRDRREDEDHQSQDKHHQQQEMKNQATNGDEKITLSIWDEHPQDVRHEETNRIGCFIVNPEKKGPANFHERWVMTVMVEYW